ncbi:MAG: Ig-like domain-containing protein [Gemmatimonadota bacterium]|nr:Ig-like domain-containing protein [Gemmatimonadota bacterium]
MSAAMAELTVLGATFQLAAEVRDQNAGVMAEVTVTWRSSDPSDATIDRVR